MSTKNHLNHKIEPIDQRLQAPGQQAMRSIVGQLPDDTLSLSWRSGLNERLVAESATQRKRQRLAWFLRPALGLSVAGVLGAGVFGVLMVTHSTRHGATPLPSQPDGGIEAAMVSAHLQSTFAFDVAGVGLNPVDAVNDPNAVVPKSSTGWSEDDAENL